jgi:hypothetical protein
MDTSKEYISMCSQAEAARWTKETIMDDHNYFAGTPEKVIWLPRQDQLQEMLRETEYYLTWNFYEFVMKSIEPNERRSMEKLWLLFVMKEKFNKTWNGSDWV